MIYVYTLTIKDNGIKYLKYVAENRKQRVAKATNMDYVNQTIYAGLLLDYALGHHIPNIELPVNVSFQNHAKPFLVDYPYHFNISHSEDVVCVAISSDIVGIDIEKYREIRYDIITRLSSTSELTEIASLEPLESTFAFFRNWTIKESFSKLTGNGLSKELLNIPIAFEDDCYVIKDGMKDVFIMTTTKHNSCLSVASYQQKEICYIDVMPKELISFIEKSKRRISI